MRCATAISVACLLTAASGRSSAACRSLTGTVPKTVLLDIAGRKVLDLHAGANDVRHLAPGVCFVCGSHGTRKTVIQR